MELIAAAKWQGHAGEQFKRRLVGLHLRDVRKIHDEGAMDAAERRTVQRLLQLAKALRD